MVTARQIAELTGASIQGAGDIELTGMKHWKYVRRGELTFALNDKELEEAEKSDCACVVTENDVPEEYQKTVLKVKNLKKALTIVYNAAFAKSQDPAGIHPTAVMDPDAHIGKDVHVGACAVVKRGAFIGDGASIGEACVIGENVRIGPGTVLHPNVTIYEACRIGSGVSIHASSVIGADGFGYVPDASGILKVPQMGAVVIGDNVEIGANTCIDRGTFTDTVIGAGTKIDNLVQIAHNVKIGKKVLIAAQVGMGGSTTVGDNTMMAGQVGIADHVTVPENVKFGAQCGVSGKLHEGQTYLGSPVRNVKDWMRLHALMSVFLKNIRKVKKFIRELPEE